MNELMCFTHIEFADDPNVVGRLYWYSCPFEDVEEGDEVIAPLGRHNNLQKGVVREVLRTESYNAPFPLYMIKYVKEVLKKDMRSK